MIEETFNDKILTDYLLGSLTDAEAERIDELTFTDAELSGRLNSVENDLIDAYAAGELVDADLQQFESFYLASPLRREKVFFARAFQEFGEKRLRSEVPPGRETSEADRKPSIFSGLLPPLKLGFVTAAVLLIGVAGWLWYENMRQRDVAVAPATADQDFPREANAIQPPAPTFGQNAVPEAQADETASVAQEPESGNLVETQPDRKSEIRPRSAEKLKNRPVVPMAVATFLLAPPMRGPNQIETITIPPGTDRAAFKLELESNDFPTYRLVLREQATNRVIWQSGAIRAVRSATQAALNASIPARLLHSRIYTFSVTAISAADASEIISDYTFRIVR